MPEPTKEITTANIRNLKAGQTLSIVDYLDPACTIAEVKENSTHIKDRAYRRFHKTVSRVRSQTGFSLQLATQLVWNDRYGMSVLTTITREA